VNASSAANLLLKGVPPKRPPIVLIGHGRSGTSWIANTLARSPEVLYYNEPCNPDRWPDAGFAEWFTHAERGAECPYLERAYSGAVRGLFVPGRAWSRSELTRRVFRNPRVLVKGVASVMAAGWVQQRYDAKMVSVYRHPCAVALSEYERDVDAAGSRHALLDSPTMWSGRYATFRAQIEAAAAPFEIYGAIWGLRNRVLLDAQRASDDWGALHYEELAREPVSGFESLFTRLGIGWSDEIARFVSDTTSTHQEGHYATSRISSERVGRWKSELTPEQVEQTLSAAAPFEVPFSE
jgi:hypothetical protein